MNFRSKGKGKVEQLLVDILNGVWAGDAYNEICRENPILIPVSELEIREALLEATGSDFVTELGNTPFTENMTLRDHAKAVVKISLKAGCDSEGAQKLRARIESDLSKTSQVFRPS